MRRESCEIAILGAGFGGGLLAAIARKLGRDVILIERGRHPRFAIGESSTPLANLKLAQLSETYDLSWLKPLTKYGPWKRAYPGVACGPKRGFSFFHHQPGSTFQASPLHENELLVAANPDAERGDTHWFRHDVDAFIVEQAVGAGVRYIDQCEVTRIEHNNHWHLGASREGEEIHIHASFLVDATGGSGVLAKIVGQADESAGLHTWSRALFSHFENVGPWSHVLRELGALINDHPFPCDSAALHHIIDGGWMWVLRFDNGITSAGFSLDPRRYPSNEGLTPEDEWAGLMSRYPSIRRQFADARPVRPLTTTDRLQRKLRPAVGADWAALPHSTAFIDPWLSPGIAHSLFGIERLARIIAGNWASPDRADRLASYSRSTMRELDLIDEITAACFGRFDCFPVMTTLSMLYFVAVTHAERRIRAGRTGFGDEFLLADDEGFTSRVREIIAAGRCAQPADAAAFSRFAADRLEPYNTAGLLQPTRRNMYHSEQVIDKDSL